MASGAAAGRPSRKLRRGEQGELTFRTWGGRRDGAGRKRRSKASVAHVARPAHSRHHPLHVTLRAAAEVPNFRGKRAFRALKRALQLANTHGKHREHFRVTHYSVQSNHVHLVAEASDRSRLSRGVQGLAIRMARRLNLSLERRGKVFSERYHARALRTPREVRHALAYVLLNERRHLASERGLSLPPWHFDPCSSAAEFDGWRPLYGLDPPLQAPHIVTAPSKTFLLTHSWRRHGLIAPDEVPAAKVGQAAAALRGTHARQRRSP